jgi:hypothetical protein
MDFHFFYFLTISNSRNYIRSKTSGRPPDHSRESRDAPSLTLTDELTNSMKHSASRKLTLTLTLTADVRRWGLKKGCAIA